jgi:Flp pilus assembly protein TadG
MGRTSFERDVSGASAVEFAIVVPVFLTMLFGILAYGIYFGAVHSTSQLAADAARASVAGLSDTERASIATAHVHNNVPAYVLLDPERIEVTAEPLEADARQFRVSVRYDASLLPIWNFTPFLPLPERTIERTATIQRGGY